MEKKLVFSSDIIAMGFSLDKYKRFLTEQKQSIPQDLDDNSLEYEEWAMDSVVDTYYSILDKIKSGIYNKPCVVTGSVVTLDGRMDIEEKQFDALYDAIDAIHKKTLGCGMEIYVDENAVYVNVYGRYSKAFGAHQFKIVIKDTKIENGTLF